MKSVWVTRDSNDTYKIYKEEPFIVKKTDGTYIFECSGSDIYGGKSTYLTPYEREKYHIEDINVNEIANIDISEEAYHNLFRSYDLYYDD